MYKKKHPLMNTTESAEEIQVSGSFIAEFPSGEEADFTYDTDSIPVLPMKESVAYPGHPQPVKIEN